mgnify:CR=1 FL=1
MFVLVKSGIYIKLTFLPGPLAIALTFVAVIVALVLLIVLLVRPHGLFGPSMRKKV